MQPASERVHAFFQRYESNIRASDPAVIAAQYAESFVFAGPQGVQAVRRDDFLKILPKRQDFFASVGLRSSRLVALEEAGFDDGAVVLVKVQWRMQFGATGPRVFDVDVSSTYLLQQQADGLKVVFQLDHDDLMKRVHELGLA